MFAANCSNPYNVNGLQEVRKSVRALRIGRRRRQAQLNRQPITAQAQPALPRDRPTLPSCQR